MLDVCDVVDQPRVVRARGWRGSHERWYMFRVFEPTQPETLPRPRVPDLTLDVVSHTDTLGLPKRRVVGVLDPQHLAVKPAGCGTPMNGDSNGRSYCS
jgi:hypothetical protein